MAERCDCPAHEVAWLPYTCPTCRGIVTPDAIDLAILEAYFAQWLDSQRVPWIYEPECFADEHGQYLPDFRATVDVVYPDGRLGAGVVYFEVKPALQVDVDAVLRRMEIIWSSEPDALLALATPHDAGYWTFPVGAHGGWSWAYWHSTLWSNDREGQSLGVLLQLCEALYRHWTDRPAPDDDHLTSPWPAYGHQGS